MNIFKYFSARSHLKEINKTVEVMGDDVSPILLAQKEMTEDEVTYFYYKSLADVIYTLIFTIVLIGAYGAYNGI